MNPKRIIGIALLMVLIATIGAAIANIFMMRDVMHIGTIKVYGDFNLYEDDICTIVLTELNWGDLYTANTYEEVFYIMGDGENKIQVAWNVTDLPTGVTFSMKMQRDGYPEAAYAEDYLTALDIDEIITLTATLEVGITAVPDALSLTQTFYADNTPY